MKLYNQILTAISNKDRETVKRLILEHPYVLHFESDNGWPILHACIADPVNLPFLDLDLVKRFVDYGGDLERRTPEGFSLLFLATVNCRGKEIAEFLTSCGMSLNPFEQAVAVILRGDAKTRAGLISELLEKHPELASKRGTKGYTLLHYAMRSYDPELIRVLLKHGLNVNAVSYNGRSPLGLCGWLGEACEKIRAMLIANGARTTKREELADLLMEGRDTEAIRRFEADPSLANASVWPPGSFLLRAARSAKSSAVVEYLLKQGVDVNVANQDGETALHLVMHRHTAEYEDPATDPIIDILLAHGADMERRDHLGFTPLHATIEHWQEKATIKLIERGANINALTNAGETPRDLVYKYKFLGFEEMGPYLKSKGAIRAVKASTAKQKGR